MKEGGEQSSEGGKGEGREGYVAFFFFFFLVIAHTDRAVSRVGTMMSLSFLM